jgi:hypothetical protein
MVEKANCRWFASHQLDSGRSLRTRGERIVYLSLYRGRWYLKYNTIYLYSGWTGFLAEGPDFSIRSADRLARFTTGGRGLCKLGEWPGGFHLIRIE